MLFYVYSFYPYNLIRLSLYSDMFVIIFILFLLILRLYSLWQYRRQFCKLV